MSRFFVPKEFVKADSIYITGLEAHHILDVMRLKVSDEVVIFDGTGREYTGIVSTADRKSLEVRITSARELGAKRGPALTLIQAIPKKDRMDYIAQKATELGVSRIIPVITGRTIPEWKDAKKSAIVERWRKIAREAAKQCGRSDLPEVCQITEFKDVITGPVYDLKLIAALSDEAIRLKDALRGTAQTAEGSSRRLNVGYFPATIAIAIGPEGDFTPAEVECASAEGFKTVSLGPRVLKSDTAGLAALSMINYEYEG
jgi:16S rRNA (uracil1498-N3)-methyltransferase